MSRPTTRRSPRLENLETRQLLTAGPSPEEQYMLELVNEARTDPGAAMLRVQEGLTDSVIDAVKDDGESIKRALEEIGEAGRRAPVAWNADLAEAARSHSGDLIDRGVQSHYGRNGETATDRAVAAGYDDPVAIAENVIVDVESADHAMQAFLLDWNNPGDPHRKTIQQPDQTKENWDDLGVAIVPFEAERPGFPGVTHETRYAVTQVFGRREGTPPRILGVVYTDRDGDEFYDVSERAADASIVLTRLRDSGASTAGEPERVIEVWASGGYQADVAPGRYRLELRRGGVPTGRTAEVVVGSENVKVDFRLRPETAAQLTSSEASTSGAQARSRPSPAHADSAAVSLKAESTFPLVHRDFGDSSLPRPEMRPSVTALSRSLPGVTKPTPTAGSHADARDRVASPPARKADAADASLLSLHLNMRQQNQLNLGVLTHMFNTSPMARARTWRV